MMVKEEMGWLKTVENWGEIQDKVLVDKQPSSGPTDNSECSSPFTFNWDPEDMRKTQTYWASPTCQALLDTFLSLSHLTPVRILGSGRDQPHSWERKVRSRRLGDLLIQAHSPTKAQGVCVRLTIRSSCSAGPAKTPRWGSLLNRGGEEEHSQFSLSRRL